MSPINPSIEVTVVCNDFRFDATVVRIFVSALSRFLQVLPFLFPFLLNGNDSLPLTKISVLASYNLNNVITHNLRGLLKENSLAIAR
jgi:hypothetical protein